IGSAVYDDAAIGAHFDPVPVPPHTRDILKITGQVTGKVRVAPEIYGHRRHRAGNHHVSYHADDRLMGFIERIQAASQSSGLYLTADHGLIDHAPDKGRADIRAATHRAE